MYKSCKLFEGINKEEYNKIMPCLDSQVKLFKAGEIILDYRYKNSKVGILEEGSAYLIRVDIDGNRTVLDVMGENSIFGEVLAFSGGGEENMYVECLSPCKIIFIDYDHITKRCEGACDYHTLLVQNMFQIMAEKLLSLSNRVEVLSHRTIRQKLICYFNICAGAKSNPSFTLPFNMSTLAHYIGSDRSAMMREIKNMKTEGIIDVDKRQISLLNFN